MNEPTPPVEKTPADIEEDIRLTYHEVGHFLGCLHFKIAANPVVFSPGERFPEFPASTQNVAGECRMERSGTTYQNAVIGWCGVLAEIIAGVSSLDTGFALTPTTQREVHSVLLCNFEKLSRADQILIAGYRSTWATFKTAYKLLRHQKPKLHRLVAMKLKSPAAPQPMNTPALTASVAERAVLLEKFLASMKPDDPDRERFEKILNHLKRGEEPPNSIFRPEIEGKTLH